MLLAAKQLAMNARDPPTYQSYSNHSHSLSEAIKRLVSSIREGAPGNKECDNALRQINQRIQDLDRASLAAVSQQLSSPNEGGSVQSYQEHVANSARQLLEHIDPIRNAAKSEPETLGHLVSVLLTTSQN